MKEKVIDTYYWLGHLGSYEVKGFIYDEDTGVLTLYTYTDDEKNIKTIVDLSYADSLVQLETFTDEEINEHLLETYEEYVHHEDLESALKENEKVSKSTYKRITQKQIKELIKRILKVSYADVLELRYRSSLDGSGEIYQEDHLTLDIVLDLYDLLNLLLNGADEESIKDKFLEIAEFYHWDFELNDFTDYEEEQDSASFYVWQLANEMKK